MRQMFRYSLPVDGGTYMFGLTGDPVAVATQGEDVVEFWAEHDDDAPEVKRAFCVFGTGHEVYARAKWVGTCPRTASGLVWHLYEIPVP